MSQIIAPNGSLEVAIPSGEKLAIATRGRANYALKLDSGSAVIDSANPVPGIEIDNEEAVSAAVSGASTAVVFNSGPFDCYVEVGTAPLSKDFRRETGRKGASVALNATGTITTAMILSGSVTSTTASDVTATLETGAVADAASEWEIGESYDWGVTNTGGTNAFTVTAAASGHTVVGAGAVANSTSALFRTEKTAAATFVTTRIG